MSTQSWFTDLPCVAPLYDAAGRHVVILQRLLGVQTENCVQKHGEDCSCISRAGGTRLARNIFTFPREDEREEEEAMFSFTSSRVVLEATTRLHTHLGPLLCIPDTEYHIWRKAGYCHVAPLVIHLDDVRWRVIASENAVVDGDDVITLDDEMNHVVYTYLRAHKEGGRLLEEVKTAVRRGDKDLEEHRMFLFKVFFIVGVPPTLSHDLTKTTLVNFCLSRCFANDDLDLLKEAVTSEECMALVRTLHMEVENHHPEHGPRPAIIVRDMYLDRVSRGVQKSHGWDNKAWHIPERFAPAEYKDDFARLEERYGGLSLEDPGHVNIPDKLPGAVLNLAWEDWELV